jgi:hypothetical protein
MELLDKKALAGIGGIPFRPLLATIRGSALRFMIVTM